MISRRVAAATALAAISTGTVSTAAVEASTHRHGHHAAAHAARASHPLHGISIPRWAVRLAAKHRHAAGRPARTGSHQRAARYTMPRGDVRRLIRVSWQAFGYRGHPLSVRVARNYRQVMRESAGRPAVLQGYIGDVNDHHPAGGLLQFTAPTMHHWQVASRADRFNPLDNLLAAVNAQAHGPYYVLNGRSGWSPPLSRNPLRGRNAFAVVAPRPKPRPEMHRVSATPQVTPTAKPVARRAIPAATPTRRDVLARTPRVAYPPLYLLIPGGSSATA